MLIEYLFIQEFFFFFFFFFFFDALKDVFIFSTIDLFSGYHQLLMYEGDQEITSFNTKYSSYHLKGDIWSRKREIDFWIYEKVSKWKNGHNP